MTPRIGARAQTGSRNMAVMAEIDRSTSTSYSSPIACMDLSPAVWPQTNYFRFLVWLRDCEKSFDIIYSAVLMQYRRVTDGQTSCSGIVRAMHSIARYKRISTVSDRRHDLDEVNTTKENRSEVATCWRFGLVVTRWLRST